MPLLRGTAPFEGYRPILYVQQLINCDYYTTFEIITLTSYVTDLIAIKIPSDPR